MLWLTDAVIVASWACHGLSKGPSEVIKAGVILPEFSLNDDNKDRLHSQENFQIGFLFVKDKEAGRYVISGPEMRKEVTIEAALNLVPWFLRFLNFVSISSSNMRRKVYG